MEINGHFQLAPADEIVPAPNSLPLHPMLMQNEDAYGNTFDSYLSQLESSLRQMLDQGKTIYTELAQTLSQLQTSNPLAQNVQDEAKSDVEIIRALKSSFNIPPNSPYQIKLSSTIGQVLYKNKPFSLKLIISGPKETNIGKIVLKIRIYTYEMPPKEILYSMKGEAILVNARTKEINNERIIKFKRVSFTEVSSRYPEKKVIMLVSADGRSDIKPLIIDGLQIKSRMPNQLSA